MKKVIKHKASLIITSHPMYLSMVRVFLEKLLRLIDLPTSIIEDLKSAVDEACSNVIKYAYKNDYTRSIKVEAECSRNEIEVIIEDRGEAPVDKDFKGRDLSDIRPGGLGMHFIRKAFDRVSFTRRGNVNKLKLVRRF